MTPSELTKLILRICALNLILGLSFSDLRALDWSGLIPQIPADLRLFAGVAWHVWLFQVAAQSVLIWVIFAFSSDHKGKIVRVSPALRLAIVPLIAAIYLTGLQAWVKDFTQSNMSVASNSGLDDSTLHLGPNYPWVFCLATSIGVAVMFLSARWPLSKGTWALAVDDVRIPFPEVTFILWRFAAVSLFLEYLPNLKLLVPYLYQGNIGTNWHAIHWYLLTPVTVFFLLMVGRSGSQAISPATTPDSWRASKLIGVGLGLNLFFGASVYFADSILSDLEVTTNGIRIRDLGPDFINNLVLPQLGLPLAKAFLGVFLAFVLPYFWRRKLRLAEPSLH